MKKILLSSAFLLCLLAISAQTKQIAHKSHSGGRNEFFSSDYQDNFGLPPQEIDSIIILKNTCVVEVMKYPRFFGRDTVCDHPYFTQGYTEDKIRSMYPSDVVFIGFENYKTSKKLKKAAAKKTSRTGSLHYLAILAFLGMGALYVFNPKISKHE